MEEKEKDEETTSWNNGKLDKNEDEEAWGTLEELLLVCAVNRHGTNCWDSIAKELQKRMKHSSSNNHNNENSEEEGEDFGSSFSSRNCQKKYVHLKRRFHYEKVEKSEEVEEDDGGEEYLLRMVDELRKLRVEELKREVHRHDVSIVSLQLKVKRLEDERETCKVKEEEDGGEAVLSDLRNKPGENAIRNSEKFVEPERYSPEKILTGDSAENRSCNESNSTNHQKTDNLKAVTEERESKLKREPEEPDPVKPEKNRSKPVGGEGKMSRLGELEESLSESRRGGDSTKQQSSDVQSSASLSKKKRRRFKGDSGDELEVEELSPANKRINAKSQPLIRFLEILRSHKHGSVFQRRLPSQETEKHQNVIRQHMDLDMVQSRLDKGIYCDCHPKFYRDLLLIFTNAVLFYRKSSAEHIAARELRKLVIDEITQKTRKPKIQPRKPDPEPQHLEPVVKKPRSSTTMVVCRRRSSMQALSDSMKKGDTKNTSTTNSKINDTSSKVENGSEEKIKPNHLPKKFNGNSGNDNNNNSSNSISSKMGKHNDRSGGGGGDGGGEGEGEGNLKKLLTKERSNLGNGSLRLSNNSGKKIISKDGTKGEKIANVSKDKKEEISEGEGAEGLEGKKINVGDQKQEKATPATVLKKQGVANFLKRMKQNSPSSQEKAKNNDLEEEEDEEKGGKREKSQIIATNGNVKKTNGNIKKIVKEVEVNATRRSSGRKGEKEAAASRRAIGRPPKRKAAMMSGVGGGTPDSARGRSSGGRDGGDKFKKKPRR